MKPLEQWLKESADFAAMLFKEKGSLAPMWVGETKDGKIIPVLVEMSDKDMVAEAVRAIFRTKQVVRYIFMTEAWVLAADKNNEKDMTDYIKSGKSVSNHPDRREIIMVNAEDKSKILMGQMFILRPEHGKPAVSPLKIIEQDRVEGRFTGMLSEV